MVGWIWLTHGCNLLTPELYNPGFPLEESFIITSKTYFIIKDLVGSQKATNILETGPSDDLLKEHASSAHSAISEAFDH